MAIFGQYLALSRKIIQDRAIFTTESEQETVLNLSNLSNGAIFNHLE